MVVGPVGPDDFADNVCDSLSHMGHQVVAAGPSRKLPPLRRLGFGVEIALERVPALDRSRQQGLAERVLEECPDLLLTMDRRLHGSVVAAAKSVGARTALWFPDHVGNMDRHQMFLAGYDRIYIKNPLFVRRLREIYGVPAVYMPEAANSRWHRPTAEYGSRPVIVMAGSVHPTRALLLDRLIADGVTIEIYGSPMPSWLDLPRVRGAHTGLYLRRQEKANTFRGARAVLNNLHPAEFAGINCRVFEGAASGAVVLTEPREGLPELFEVGREVDTFDSYDELLSKIRSLLDSPDVGRPMADAAALRAHSDHTYELRLAAILNDLGLG
jgi:hypothetical protein